VSECVSGCSCALVTYRVRVVVCAGQAQQSGSYRQNLEHGSRELNWTGLAEYFPTATATTLKESGKVSE
jgi:hypothetical protein